MTKEYFHGNCLQEVEEKVLPTYLLSFAAFPHLSEYDFESYFAKWIFLRKFFDNNCLEIHHHSLPVNDKDAPPAILTRFGLAKDGFGNNAFFFLRFCFPPFAPLA